jgi:Protein of unknown function, DUF481
MFRSKLCAVIVAVAFVMRLIAQAPSAQPDILILTNDERLEGHLVSADAKSLTFKSNLLGNVTTDWKNVRELQTHGQYAVIPKGAKLRPHMETGSVPQGTLQATAQTINITPPAGGPPRAVPLAEAAQVIEEGDFQKQVQPPSISFFKAWTGAITAAGSLVVATQQSRTFTGAVNLVRAIPTEANFPPRNRTTFNFSGSEGYLQEPGAPKLKTEIVHADAERDEYFTDSRVYAFVQAAFDHNYSQGLTLQQIYGGGIGWTMINRPNETLDLKGNVEYIHQQFEESAADKSLIGSSFSENLLRKFARGETFTEQLTVTPTWDNLNSWLALASAGLNIPAYKRLTFTLSVLDSYLHNPSPGFKKNSFQATTGLTYTFR